MDILILSAGSGRRMGGISKGLLDYGLGTWLEYQMDQLFKLGLGMEQFVVLGFQSEQYKSKIKNLNKKCHLSINASPQLGTYSSLSVGLKSWLSYQGKESSGIFILPVDHLVPSPKVWMLMMECLGSGVEVVLPPWGHPVLISRNFAKKLVQLPVDAPEARLDLQIQNLKSNKVKRLAQEQLSEAEKSSLGLQFNTPFEWNQLETSMLP